MNHSAWGRTARALSAWVLCVASACVMETGGTSDHQSIVLAISERTVEVRRSLVVTEQPILERFSFARVMNQLVAQANVPNLTATSLFNQWWDTQNPGPGLGLGLHCDSQVDALPGPSINDFPYLCRESPAEGSDAGCDPFAAGSSCAYIPIALFNRFDLAPQDGAHCGEHRIVFARDSGRTQGRMRNLLIFEAILPNPHPVQGLMGCKKIVDFWADLSDEPSLSKRASALETFYFTGLANVEPVVHVTHYGDNALGAGQIRTNQFMQPSPISPSSWDLREFKVMKECASDGCALRVNSVTNKTNPFGRLFDPFSSEERAPGLQALIAAQVEFLAAESLAGISMDIPDTYNSAQSPASGSTEADFPTSFGSDEGSSPFRTAIELRLAQLGSTLSADAIVERAMTQTCAGCHRRSNEADLGGELEWPASLGFTHVSERDVDLEVVDGVTRYKISPALENAFLPVRKVVMEDYLNDKPLNARAGRSIGNRDTH
jgi:hypothetical protein